MGLDVSIGKIIVDVRFILGVVEVLFNFLKGNFE